jgi:solute carrier family 25 phosphate transporter 3
MRAKSLILCIAAFFAGDIGVQAEGTTIIFKGFLRGAVSFVFTSMKSSTLQVKIPSFEAAGSFTVAMCVFFANSRSHCLLGILPPFPYPAPDYRFFVAGGVCAACSHGITTPIDVVKTKIQTNPSKYKGGMLKAAKEIVAEEGAGYLLAGLGPTVVGYGLEGAAKFGFYESLKPISMQVINNKAVAFLVASIIAGAVASILLCPMESTRIRLVTDPKFASGLITGLPKLIKEEGLGSTFDGLAAMLAKQVPYTLGKQVSFDVFAGIFYSLADSMNLDGENMKFVISFGAAFCAAILACLSSQPGDMVLTQTYKGKSSGKGFNDIVSDIWAQGGLPAFFSGTGARLVHVISIITSQLMIYDLVKMGLGLPATGSH